MFGEPTAGILCMGSWVKVTVSLCSGEGRCSQELVSHSGLLDSS